MSNVEIVGDWKFGDHLDKDFGWYGGEVVAFSEGMGGGRGHG
jgi:hypothetical protein